jgi:cysteinyl-tRNA synthetase
VLDVLDRRVRSGVVSMERLAIAADEREVPADANDAKAVDALIRARQTARKAKDFARADAIRTDLKRRGVTIEDMPKGVRWKLD